MIRWGLVSVQGPAQLPVKRKGLSSKEGVKLFFICCQGLGGLATVIYECNNGCLGERKSIIVGCYLVGLEAFL